MKTLAVVFLFALTATACLAQVDDQRRPRPDGPPPLIQKIEAALGEPLTDQQKQQIHRVTKEAGEELRKTHAAFVQKVSKITGLDPKVINEAMKAVREMDGNGKDFIAALEEAIGEPLTDQEKKLIAAAAKERRETASQVERRVATAISKITGLPIEDILEMLPGPGPRPAPPAE